VNPEAKGSESYIEEAIRLKYGENIDHPTWLKGLIEGALAKYGEIRAKLG
jgi:hypothetical protein